MNETPDANEGYARDDWQNHYDNEDLQWDLGHAQGIPLGRAALGADIAKMAAFLGSAESDYITGLSIPVAGGSQMD